MKRFLKLLPLAAVLAAFAQAQPTGGYVENYIVKVKPEKRADFEAVAKKIAEAKRRHKGDAWLAYVTEYGDNNTVSFVSVRENYASIDKASAAFMSAMKEGYGPTFTKVFQDMNNCLVSSRAEIRRRRFDLSSNVPAQSALMKNIGESKWIRYFTVRVKTGHNNDFEENAKLLKAAFEKQPSRNPILVSQAAVGQTNGTYYFASF